MAIEEETILGLSIKEAYILFKVKSADMIREDVLKRDEIDKVKNGIRLKMQMEDYLKGRYRENPKDNTVTICTRDRYKLDDFRSEFDERENIIRGRLMEFYALENDIIKPPKEMM